MKVVKETGLVPVTFDVPWGPYHPGDTGGVKPGDVAPILAGRFGVLAAIPEGVETVDMEDADVLATLAAPPRASKQEAAMERQASVEIPDDWRAQHHLQRLRIASQIKGANVPSVELADRTIEDELARRGRGATVFQRGVANRGNPENQGDGGPSIPPSGGPIPA